jgi:phage FluMu protein Com
MIEQWTEVRCIACVPLGWYSSHLLLRLQGVIPPCERVTIELKCPRCKSIILWTLGKPEFVVKVEGVRNHKRQLVAFE